MDLLTDTDARQMLVRRLGEDRVEAQPQAVQQIIAQCARLPLALSIVAARAAAHPDFPLTDLAEELRDAEGRLQALDRVTAVFSWSYRQLSDPAARLFRLLGLHPGPDITAPAAASLAAVPLTAARLMLAELADANLITEHTPGRFTFHDLLRAYATTQTRTYDPGTDRNAALERMLDHYLHTAQAAWYLSYPHQQQAITLAPPLPGVTPEAPADYPAAWAWFTAEYPVLLAAIQLAADTGHHTLAWQLPHTLVPFFERQGHWHDFAATHQIALAATQHHADQQGQAHAHLGIGHARARFGRLDEARLHLQDALRLFEDLGDQAGRSHAHNLLGLTFHTEERYGEALVHMQQAVDLALRRTAATSGGSPPLSTAWAGSTPCSETPSRHSPTLSSHWPCSGSSVTGGARPPRSTPSATHTSASATISRQPATSNKSSPSTGNSATSIAKPPTTIASAMPTTPQAAPPKPATPGS